MRMILLVTSSERASEFAEALHGGTGERIVVAESLVRASTLLREDSYLAVVLDQYLLETEPDEAETTIEQMDTAILVQVNLAVSGKARLLREVRAALQCRQREEGRARRAAIGQLYSELNDTVTALLLSSELVLETVGPRTAGRTAGRTPGEEKLQSLHELVKKLRRQLETAAPPEEFQECRRV
jgi:hypothetical protein